MCLHTKSKNKGEWRAVRKWSVNMFNHRVINFIMAGDFPYTKICTEKSVSTASLDDMSTAAAAALHPKKTQQHLSLARIKIQNNKYFFISWHNFSLVSLVFFCWAVYRWKLLCVIFVVFGNAMHDLWSPGKLSEKEIINSPLESASPLSEFNDAKPDDFLWDEREHIRN